jgi:hypothetical protein
MKRANEGATTERPHLCAKDGRRVKFGAVIRKPRALLVLLGGVFVGACNPGVHIVNEKLAEQDPSLADTKPVSLTPPGPFQAVAPGEHPRLFFRKSDLPNIKALAATDFGKAWVGKLKKVLGGGEALRTDLTGFTMSDAFGFGFLYQLTGTQAYADACRQAIELYLGGTPDRDPRYNWAAPTGFMDFVGPSFASVAMAYDLCYDGWDDAFRMMVAQKLMSYQCPNAKIEGWPTDGSAVVTLDDMAVKPPGDPGFWTFGPTVGGAGLTVLATMGDPGVDPTQTATLLAGVEANIDRVFAEGWGEMGGFYKMAQQGEIMANEGFVPLMQAMRVALGKDYVADQPGAQWMTMHWAFDLMKDPNPTATLPRYPDRHDAPSLATTFAFHGGMYDEGSFWQGFGAVSDALKPALVWSYETLHPERGTIDYPQHAVFAMLNLPQGLPAQNPGDVLGHVLHDHLNGLYELRKTWQDENDIMVTALVGGQSDEMPTTSVIVWGFGFRTTFGSMPTGDSLTKRPRTMAETLVSSPDGSSVLSVSGSSLAVDFSGASGAEALLAFVGARDDLKVDQMRHEDFGARASTTQVMLGTTPVNILTLQSKDAPVVSVSGSNIVVGQQTISWNGTSLALGNMPAASH